MPETVVIDGSVTTDSRDCGPGSLYVARVGETADGHDFVASAVSAGAVAALASRPVEGVPCVLVDDVQTAFGRVARAVVDRAPELRIVGVTGSSGKTSVKDLLASVLSSVAETVAPVNSLNGEIGVPLTVCRVTPTTRFLVAEMGARGIGHIDYLTQIAPPQVAIVLNVGSAHVGEFGSRENIARAKSELPRAVPAEGLSILNADDPVVAAMAGASPPGCSSSGSRPRRTCVPRTSPSTSAAGPHTPSCARRGRRESRCSRAAPTRSATRLPSLPPPSSSACRSTRWSRVWRQPWR